MPQFWGGFIKGKLHTHWVRDSGSSRVCRVAALYTKKGDAQRDYKDVRKVETRDVSKKRAGT